MTKKLTFTLLFLLTFSSIFGREGLLNIVISIDIKNTPVKAILKTIEKKAAIFFSYNPGLIDENRLVTLSLEQKTIGYGLALVFDETIRFKEVGSHIVLLKNEDKEVVKARKKTDQNYSFTGIVKDKNTGKPLEGASIYDVNDRHATLSNAEGKYKLEIPQSENVRSLYFQKIGYRAQVVVVDLSATTSLEVNASLELKPDDVEKINPSSVEKIEPVIDNKGISGALVSPETFVHGQNLEDIKESRLVQISLVPSLSIGSNLSTNALITNNFSLNVIAGFSGGVSGAEIGGVANFVKGDVRWAQVGGVANLVGGDVLGAQIAGVSNLVQGNFTGAQVAGVSSILKKDLYGAQVSGVTSIVRGGFTGVQISGVSNISFKKSHGAQISGVYNLVRDSLVGAQISGVANTSNGGLIFLQIAGVSNYACNNSGLQISGVQNFAGVNNGLQIGIINSSINGNGCSIGLFNFVKEGYHKTEVSTNEIFPVNLTYKTGTQRLYNTYNFGVTFGPNPAYAAGLGFGTYFTLSEKLQLSLDGSGQLVFENNFVKFEFAQLYKISTSLDIKLAKWVTLFAGPTFNYNNVAFKNGDGEFATNISFAPLIDQQNINSRSIFWMGGQVGFRF